ncbi:MAG: EAL domain-containing protein [Zoogloeaceae bacterium]|jgi:diguanylate cyclase (GGDEF)-like protein/PAS domain S-box-containing protein|nr:EAL domain-containing protein [Zoogloeaceae bacterium]
MNKDFRPLFQALLPWLLLAILGSILLVLNILSRSVNENERNRVEQDIRQIETLDTRINFDVLRLHHRQLLAYDSLSASAEQIDTLLGELQNSFAYMNLPDALKGSRESWQRKNVLLDDFRRQNTVLANSLSHFINLSRQLYTSQSGNPRDTISTLTRDMLIFVNEQDAKEIPVILEKLNQLEKNRAVFGNRAVTAQLFAAHGKQILNNHLPVQRQIQGISRNTFPQDIARAYGSYLKTYGEVLARAENYRRMMAAFSLLMVTCVVLIMLRLQQTARELEKSHALLDNIANHLGEGILSFDASGNLNFMNRRAELILEYAEAELIGTDIANLWPKNDVIRSEFRAALKANKPYEGEEWLQRANGERFPVVFLGGPLPRIDRAGASGYVTSFRDMTLQRQAEVRLRIAARVFDNISEAITIANHEGVIQSVNAAFTKITGYAEKEAIGHTPGKLLASGLHDRAFYKEMWRQIMTNGRWHGEIINRRKDGETYPEWLSITAVKNEYGSIVQYIGLFSDLSERKQAEAHINRLAYYDPMTGLPNRFLFRDRLKNAMHQAHRTGRPLAILSLDLDHLKAINDSLGHKTGDTLIVMAGERIGRLVLEGDTLARISGDEFMLMLPEISTHADVATLASRMLSEFSQPFTLGEREFFVSISIGIAVYPADVGDESDLDKGQEILMKNADIALHNAKNAGRACFRFFLESDSAYSLEQLELEADLRHSIERNELRLYYQPQIDIHSGMIHGVEALVRWQHPTRGLLTPVRFIQLAENIGFIDALGDWCLETACRQFVEWQRKGIHIQRVSVNVSARQLRDPDFSEKVLMTVQSTGIPPACLELELTESSMSHDPERVFGIFSQLRQTGIRIAIDDFGTGYSSLSYLSRYPVDVLKIDKSFIDHVSEAEDALSVVQAIIVLAHTLKMVVVAEGVETEAQRQTLVSLGCDLLQGFLYSRPCPSSDLMDLPYLEEGIQH